MYLLGKPAGHEDEADEQRQHEETGLCDSQTVQPVHLVVELGDLGCIIYAIRQAVAGEHYNEDNKYCDG